ncbi:axotactin-like isoform X3 [Babylonia areolata]|uniref:axotactin-like isoform X3 n=1 Tax=Babylonia areolata TaxID=304850 RepID=UPI003FD47766
MTHPPHCRRLSAMGNNKCLLLLLLLSLLVLSPFWSSNLAKAQTTSAASEDGGGGGGGGGTPSSWTFSDPGVSHITFSPPLTDSHIFRLQLSFRTLQANGVLVYQDVADHGEEEGEEEKEEESESLLDSFHLFVAMRQGYLRVGHMFDQLSDVLNIGRALNDDQWHTLSLTLNQTSGELSVTLDTNSVTQFLKAFLWGNARDVLDWSRVPTSVRLGGPKEASSPDHTSFVGCLKDLQFSTDPSATPLLPVPVGRREGVRAGCVDRCEGGGGADTRCQNQGRCVNLYTRFHCDCFGTDFEGQSCETQGPTVLTLSGYEWLTYQLYQGDENRPLSGRNRIALEFKTERPSGILLYAVGGSPYHNHITAALHSGVLHVSVAFGDDDLDFSIGIGLDDDRWHNVTIVHSGERVEVHVDGDVTSRTVKNANAFLSLDPLAYIGGGENFVITRGLPVTRNFVGCLKNVYFNDISVLYKLSNGSDVCKYHGGEKPTYGCSPVQDIPISFPNAASVLRWSVGARGENLTVQFQFRTVREDSILFYVELMSQRDGGGWDYGLIEVWVTRRQPMLMFVPSLRNGELSENITLPLVVNDQHWHSMHILLQNSQAKLKVDAVSRSTHQYSKPLSHKGQVILGFGLRGYKPTEGYVGCMEQIVIQGRKVDPIQVVESSSAIGLRLDGCHLVDHCSTRNVCQHGSTCLSDWAGVQCQCLDRSYEGKACHFPRYPRSCDAYYQAGHVQSGVYLVDVDGAGPQTPSYVECAMGSQRDGHLYGATIVEHNFALNTPVRAPGLSDTRYHLDYREMSRIQLMTLARTSATCEQFFKYTCRHSPILLSKKTWFKSASGQVVDYLGPGRSGYCTCPEAGDGTCAGKGCFCDVDEGEVRQDEGYSHNREQLPIMEMTFLQHSSSPYSSSANMTLGPFTCWGSDKQHLDNLITMTTGESHVTLDTWTRGDLGFHFKTHLSRALLLMQTSGDPVFGNMFTVKIVSEHSVEFHLRLNGTVIRETLRTPRAVNQGDWHLILVEHDPHNVRLTVDTTRKLLALGEPSASEAALGGAVDFNGVLYLGGLPAGVASEYRESTPGFSGCMRAFVYNGEEVELSLLVDDSASGGVSMGCMSSCWPNPCQYGGVCREEWGEYTCRCQDPWAHQGHNCEHNLNVDAVTFSGDSPGSYLLYDLTREPQGSLDQTIVFSFRTFQRDALLLYAHDQFSNFLQLELRRGDTLVLTYNSFRTIVSGAITASAPVNDGQWQQVVAQEYYNLTKLIFADQAAVLGHKRLKLHTYFVDPFKDSAHKETVFVARPMEQPAPFVRLYVGGVGGQEATAVPLLKGCVRGMRIGNLHVNLSQGVQAKGNSSDVTAACDTGCQEDTCLNNGFCSELWRHANFTCDCSDTDFSGLRCENEASVLLDGGSVLEHTFTLPVAAQRSVTEQVLLNFRTSGSRPTSEEGEPLDMALIYVKSTEYENYIFARLDTKGSIMIETNQGVGIYRIKLSGDFANGELHELVYKREGTNMYLTLDGVKEASIVYPDYDLEKIDTIIIGGLTMDDAHMFPNTANFSGCISNTVFIPEANLDLKIRSLKDFTQGKPEVTVHGPQVVSCSEADLTGKAVTRTSPRVEITTQSFQMLTMPDWGAGPARLVTLNPPRVLTAPPSTTTASTPRPVNRTRAMMTRNKEASVDDLAIIIAVAVVGAILVITLIVALLLLYKRRRHYQAKKDPDMELKQPLNYQSVTAVQSSPVPPDHLAKLDEFSTISATLGPKAAANSAPSNNAEATMRHSQGNGPSAGEGATFEHPIFNRRKQRPASSISEVLEELERRSNRNSTGSTEQGGGAGPREGDQVWNARSDAHTPLSYEDITFFNTPLLAPIPDENEGSHVSSLSEQNSFFKEKPGDGSIPSAEGSPDNHHSLLDGNGDSGYEAESRPEVTEDDITPMGEEDDLDSPEHKLISTSGFDPEDSPVLTSPSRQRLLRPSSQDT